MGFERILLFLVGLFWPAMGVLRSKYVPESTRATIMNIFRVPLNLIVIVLLVQDLALQSVFCCCVMFLILCCAMQQWFHQLSTKCLGSLNDAKSEADSETFEGIRLVSKQEARTDHI